MITLIALILRLALLAAFSFGFVVLYEHGVDGFTEGAKSEWTALRTYALGEAPSPEDSPASAAEPENEATTEAATEPTPVPTPEPPVERIPEAPAATPAPPPPMPSPTVFSNREPSAFEALQKQPIGKGMDIPVAGKAGDRSSPKPGQ